MVEALIVPFLPVLLPGGESVPCLASLALVP